MSFRDFRRWYDLDHRRDSTGFLSTGRPVPWKKRRYREGDSTDVSFRGRGLTWRPRPRIGAGDQQFLIAQLS